MPRVPQLPSSRARTHTQPASGISVLLREQTGCVPNKLGFLITWAKIGRQGRGVSWDGDVSSFSVFFQNLVLKQECLAVKWNGIGGERKRDDNPSPTPTPCPGMTVRVRRVGGSLGPA